VHRGYTCRDHCADHGSTRRTSRKPRQYIGSLDWLDWARPPSPIRSASCLTKLASHSPPFFCESLQLDSSNSKRLVPTLCHELYMSYAGNVLSILGTNAMDVEASLAIQINELLAKPWQTSIAHRKDLPTPVVVVDALDESDRVSGRAASRCSY